MMRKSLSILFFLFIYVSAFTQIGGPWQHKVYRAVSGDGLNWTRDSSFVFFPASVPAAVVDTNQTVYLYYVKMNSASDTEKLMVATSPDGEYFYTPQLTNISGSSVLRRVDPDPVLLPDGRIRLYYIDLDMMPPQNVHSAISSDGINFTEEAGIRFKDTNGITDPDVCYTGSRWNMYLSKGSQLIRATSADGLTFSLDTSFHWNSGAVSSSIMVSCGFFRTYFCGNGIQSATSPSLAALYIESGVCIAPDANEFVCDPSVIRLNTGEYIMYFKSFSTTSVSEYPGCSCGHDLQNYPNPFSNATMIDIRSENNDDLDFSVVDFMGKLVYEKIFPAGSDKIEFQKNDLKPGIYFYRVKNKNIVIGKGKMEIID